MARRIFIKLACCGAFISIMWFLAIMNYSSQLPAGASSANGDTKGARMHRARLKASAGRDPALDGVRNYQGKPKPTKSNADLNPFIDLTFMKEVDKMRKAPTERYVRHVNGSARGSLSRMDKKKSPSRKKRRRRKYVSTTGLREWDTISQSTRHGVPSKEASAVDHIMPLGVQREHDARAPTEHHTLPTLKDAKDRSIVSVMTVPSVENIIPRSHGVTTPHADDLLKSQSRSRTGQGHEQVEVPGQSHERHLGVTTALKGNFLSATLPPRGPLTVDETLEIKHGMERQAFNVAASEQIPLDRSIPDFRPASCPVSYKQHRHLMASVIICFHNEAWTTLLRTVYSVLERSPVSLLKEIILVDDGSTNDYLGIKLEQFLLKLSSKVRLVRTPHRQGLVRARLQGVQYSSGDVLVFLDSHCECGHGWLQPLLAAVSEDTSRIAVPELDIISDTSFEHIKAEKNLHGGFDWNLGFVWKSLPEAVIRSRADDAEPKRTPTMVGGVFAVDKTFFLHLDQYDPDMDVWGGENIELSFRVWMCGGSLAILPCSRVSHVFRRVIPYDFPDGGTVTIRRNSQRVAEIWLDDFKRFFYASKNLTQAPSVVRSVASRRELRGRLHCRDFRWYLSHVIPEMRVPPENARDYGQIRSLDGARCLHVASHDRPITVAGCEAQHPNQTFFLTNDGKWMHHGKCVTSFSSANRLRLSSCARSSLNCKVMQSTTQLRCTDPSRRLSLCLDTITPSTSPVLTKCMSPSPSQSWTFTYHFDGRKLKQKYL